MGSSWKKKVVVFDSRGVGTGPSVVLTNSRYKLTSDSVSLAIKIAKRALGLSLIGRKSSYQINQDIHRRFMPRVFKLRNIFKLSVNESSL
jgi:hypothetical protein